MTRDELPTPPIPANGWMERIVANPDVEVTKLLVVVGILDSFLPDRRVRVLNYLRERYKEDV